MSSTQSDWVSLSASSCSESPRVLAPDDGEGGARHDDESREEGSLKRERAAYLERVVRAEQVCGEREVDAQAG